MPRRALSSAPMVDEHTAATICLYRAASSSAATAHAPGPPTAMTSHLAGISPVGVKSSALCFESDPLIGNAACYFNGFVYPDGDNPFRLPSAFGHFVHNSTNGSMITSSTSTMSLNLPTGYGPTMPTASGMHFTPGSGGYNGSSTAGTGAAVPTATVPPPKPTATFISSTAKTGSVDGLMTVYAVVVGGSSLLVLFLL
ncbi:MAG: hypothetical protein LQ341_003254 [Variospora aurantia]|nr:MAG: hypothetical protein LQ341_003254 [Variospora aurantia]